MAKLCFAWPSSDLHGQAGLCMVKLVFAWSSWVLHGQAGFCLVKLGFAWSSGCRRTDGGPSPHPPHPHFAAHPCILFIIQRSGCARGMRRLSARGMRRSGSSELGTLLSSCNCLSSASNASRSRAASSWKVSPELADMARIWIVTISDCAWLIVYRYSVHLHLKAPETVPSLTLTVNEESRPPSPFEQMFKHMIKQV